MTTRGRPNLLVENIMFLNELADSPEKNEILIGCDDDDFDTISVLNHNIQMENYANFYYWIEPRYDNLHIYNNMLASKATGKYLWVINDDSFIQEAGWDSHFKSLIETYLANYPDRIMYFNVESNSTDKIGDYSEFPLATREGYEALGFLEYPDIVNWGSDYITHRIYSSVERVRPLKLNTPMRHVYHENGSQPNENRDRMTEIFLKEFGGDWNLAVRNMQNHIKNVDISLYTDRLKKAIYG